MNPLADALRNRYPKIAKHLETPSLHDGMKFMVCVALGLDPYGHWYESYIVQEYRNADDEQHATLKQMERDLGAE